MSVFALTLLETGGISHSESCEKKRSFRELNETAFALNVLETGGIGCSELCEKVRYSIFSTDLASPALRRLLSVIVDFRPPNVAESREAAVRRLLARRAIGGYSLTTDDPALGRPRGEIDHPI